MKIFKIVLSVFVLLLFLNSLYAQPGKGSLLIGGASALDLSFMKEKYDADGDSEDAGSTTTIEFSPIIGYFITDALVAGVELPISLSSWKDEDNDKESTNVLILGPFARYYFGTGNMRPFVHGQVGFGSMKSKYEPDEGDSETETNGIFAWQLGGGVAMFLKENVSLDLGINYSSLSTKYDEGEVDYTYIQSGVGVNLGLSFYFGGGE